jgi:hypothetical protein
VGGSRCTGGLKPSLRALPTTQDDRASRVAAQLCEVVYAGVRLAAWALFVSYPTRRDLPTRELGYGLRPTQSAYLRSLAGYPQ